MFSFSDPLKEEELVNRLAKYSKVNNPTIANMYIMVNDARESKENKWAYERIKIRASGNDSQANKISLANMNRKIFNAHVVKYPIWKSFEEQASTVIPPKEAYQYLKTYSVFYKTLYPTRECKWKFKNDIAIVKRKFKNQSYYFTVKIHNV